MNGVDPEARKHGSPSEGGWKVINQRPCTHIGITHGHNGLVRAGVGSWWGGMDGEVQCGAKRTHVILSTNM